jgi:hypothetical protein
MGKCMKLELSDIHGILTAHDTYWSNQRPLMQKLKRAYKGSALDDTMMTINEDILVETSDGYAFVQSYVASLFAKDPALTIERGPEEKGDAKLTEVVANNFVHKQVETFKTSITKGLVFPFCGIKLGFQKRTSPLDQIRAKVIQPWDMILDTDAEEWDTQRYIGHRYYIPISEAYDRFGRKKFQGTQREEYLTSSRTVGIQYRPRMSIGSGGSITLTYVEIFEIYDLINDQRIIYSPNLNTNDGIIERIKIPVRMIDGSPCVPISPMYICYDIDKPLRGWSSLQRILRAIEENNLGRTSLADSVRRNARLFAARKGLLDKQAIQTITENKDMSIVELEISPETPISNAFYQIPSPGVNSDLFTYLNYIREDLERGSVTAPFTRGQSTNSTATEIAALSQYTSTEVGSMGRSRDLCIERVAEIYIRMLYYLLAEAEQDGKSSKIVITHGNQRSVLTADTINAAFRYTAADQSSTPMAASVKRQRFLESFGTLMSLGADPKALLKYMVREFEYSDDFIPKETEIAVGANPTESKTPEDPNPVLPVGGGETAADIRATIPDTLPQG